MNTSKYFNDWAKEDERQALKVLKRMLNSTQGMRVGQEQALVDVREAAAEAINFHPQSAEIRTFAEGL
jgi:hypothetical protein